MGLPAGRLSRLRTLLTQGLVSLAAFLLPVVAAAASEEETEKRETVILEEWRGEYILNQKMGYSYQRIWREEGLDGEVLRGSSKIVIPSQKYVMTGESLLTPDYQIKELTWQTQAAGATTVTEGKVSDSVLHVTVYSGGAVTRKEFPLTKPLASEGTALYLLKKSNFEPGTEFEIEVYSPETGALLPMTMKVIGPEEWTSDEGEVRGTIHVETRFLGIKISSWVTRDGQELESRTPLLGIRSLLETRETTELFEGFADLDQMEVIWETSVDPGVRLENPKKIVSLTLELGGVPQDMEIPSDAHQQVLSSSEETVRLRVSFNPGATGPESETSLAQHLKPSLLVQSDHEDIRREARRIAGDAEGREEQVDRLMQWMRKNIHQDLRLSVPSAAEILRTRRGDCNEHATLFAAFARSLGIPARICAGLVYFKGRFGYHAWNEVYLEGPEPHWRSVDTTIPQSPVDATHIKLAEGDDEYPLRIASLVGKLEMKIVDYSSGSD